MKNKTTVLGLMSGSSLDGLDACLVELECIESTWHFNILETETFSIPENRVHQLRKSSCIESHELLTLDVAYGEWISDTIATLATKADLIAIHGHTVFHSPTDKISVQIGSGEVIALRTGKSVVANFRNRDIFLGGQGAPLVPMGEKLLFSEFDGFLNLGGICNATIRRGDQWIAGDIGPFNQVFNHFAQQLGLAIDSDGALARSGKLLPELLVLWQSNPFFKATFPKSLANQWVVEHFLQLNNYAAVDVLHTFAHFIADQITSVINAEQPRKTLITGGGAKNGYLMELLYAKSHHSLVVPDAQIVDFKEALVFALLGLLRYRGQINVLSSCTGATQDSSSGVVYVGDQNS